MNIQGMIPLNAEILVAAMICILIVVIIALARRKKSEDPAINGYGIYASGLRVTRITRRGRSATAKAHSQARDRWKKIHSKQL
ncbi:MAG: hypothetical protein GTN80_01160 [Nitrososphaeria archaeon]|nr:hypothetical protein [Nitrososphaeria archaeon]NIN51756.1 hypothetical protein [Nitrososphaeria archaeon]NIQ32254.1 hypothetical protein [Nitrososphaeria archaeon]